MHTQCQLFKSLYMLLIAIYLQFFNKIAASECQHLLYLHSISLKLLNLLGAKAYKIREVTYLKLLDVICSNLA